MKYIYKNLLLLLQSLVVITILLSPISILANNIKINSNELILQKNNLSAKFKGNVVVSFDDVQLKTKELLVYYDDSSENKQIKSIIFPHKLTILIGVANNCNDAIVFANEGRLDYLSKKLILKGDVKVSRGDNIMVTDELTYLIKSDAK